MSTSTSAGSVMIAARTAVTMTPLAGTLFRAQRRPQLVTRHRAVAAEREQHARCAGLAGRGAEELSRGGDEQDDGDPLGAHRLGEDACTTAPPPVRHPVGVLDREQERQQQDPAADGRVEDRPPDALGRAVGRALGLLGQVRRRVVARDRVLGQDRRDRQHEEQEAEAGRRAAEHAAVVDGLGEHVAETGVLLGDQDTGSGSPPRRPPRATTPRCC